jgi:hypothetical protein
MTHSHYPNQQNSEVSDPLQASPLTESVCVLPPSPPPPAPPSPSPTPPSHHPQPTCSRPLILVLEQVLLPLVVKIMRSSVLLALVSHILTTHPLPAGGGQYVGLGAASQRPDEPAWAGWKVCTRPMQGENMFSL